MKGKTATNWVCKCKVCSCKGSCFHATGYIHSREDISCSKCGHEWSKFPRYLIYKNEKKTLTEWSKITGLRLPTIRDRIENGYTTHQTLTFRLKQRRQQKTGI